MASQPRTCAICSAALNRNNRTGYCARHVNQRPETRAKISESMRRAHRLDPTLARRKSEALKKFCARPEEKVRRAEVCRQRKIWVNSAAGHTPESRARGGRRCTATKLAWCPAHLRDDYRNLVNSKGLRAADARRIILEQHETEMNRWRRNVGIEVEPIIAPPPPVPGPTPDFIARAVEVAAAWAGASLEEFRSDNRRRTLVRARWAVMLALKRGGMRRQDIADALGKDLTTVRHGLKHAGPLAANDPVFSALYGKVVAA